MKAAFYTAQGHADDVLQIGELPTPTPQAGEVLVRLATSGANPSDVKSRAGSRPMTVPLIIPHSDGAGVIEAVGAGVDAARVGQRVWIWNGQWQRPFGTCAEYIALPSEQAVDLDEGTSFDAAACLGIPALTAFRCMFADGPVEGDKVLVSGGAGTVARYAIQMAKMGGAEVITTVSSEEKAAYVREAGADHVVNYRDANAAEQILDLTGGVHRAVELEFGVNANLLAEVMRPNGTIAAYGSAANPAPQIPFMPMMFKDLTLRMVLVYILTPEARRFAVDGLTQLLATGRMTHSVAATFALDHVAEAHELVESADKMGSVVITL
ncbi:NADPH:quinone reductase [Roseobacter sp. N2S]|uniref:NADPH:quinone reductase n=1 Tax=Roseobacter sp. N2S TaxID=2663844 RepID=UPI002856F958|nr:NADPH:quinone reductase [Roseobacter sp. N2S]MDR6263755.1 NADPH2:quinone reductase [Roseobacter sp. N2S]